MKTYKLYVCMPMTKFYVDVKAVTQSVHDNRIIFWDSDWDDVNANIIASYPSQYTIIERIIENK